MIRALLDSRLAWTVLGCMLLWSLGGVVVRGLARDPRFRADPSRLALEGPAEAPLAGVAPDRPDGA